MRNTKQLLKALTKEMPPKEGMRHNITLDGDRLQLTIMLPEGYIRLHLEDSDMDMPIGDLMNEIHQIIPNLLKEIKK